MATRLLVLVGVALSGARADELPPGAVGRIGTSDPEAVRPDSVRRLAVSPDGRLIAVTGQPAAPPLEPAIQLWELGAERPRHVLRGHADSVRALGFSRDGRTLVSTTWELHGGETRLWDVETGALRHRIDTGGTTLWFPWTGGTVRLATEGQVREYGLATGEEVGRFLDLPHGLAFSGDGLRLLGGSHKGDPLLRLFRTGGRGELLFKLTDPQTEPRAATLSFDGRTMAADDGAGRIALWEDLNGSRFTTFQTPAGRTLALAFSADGRQLAAGGTDRIVRLWDIATGQPVAQWPGHVGPVTALAFSPDGRRLFSGSTDRTVLAWDVEPYLSPAAPNPPHGPSDLARLWDELGSGAPATARRAVALLARSDAIPFLRDEVESMLFPTRDERIAGWIRDLDDGNATVRQRATRELWNVRLVARPLLEKTLAQSPSAEVRARIHRLLADLAGAPRFSAADVRRTLRTVHVLEQVAGSEAETLLQLLAQEFPVERVSQEAKLSLARLRHRGNL